MIKYYLYRIGQFLASIVPQKIAYSIVTFISDIKYLCSPRDRQAVIENLKVICGESTDVRMMARSVFRNFGKYLLEFFRMHTFDEKFIRDHVTLENRFYLEDALKRGKGVIAITAHIGNWELGGLALGRLGFPLTAIALPHKEKKVTELFNRQRAEGGVTVVLAQSAIRPCIRVLKSNGIVALLADRDFSVTGNPMTFFGRQTMIPKGTAMFAYRTGAAVVPMFLRRNDDQTFKITIGEPLSFPENVDSMSEEDFIQNLMQQQVDILEKEILKAPEDWLLFRKFWFDKESGPERIVST